MALLFAVCPVCVERHALRADGRMSIHSTAAGTKCLGEVAVPTPVTPRRAQKPSRPKQTPVPKHLSGRHLTARELSRLTPFEAEERRQDLKRRVREERNAQFVKLDPERREAYAAAIFGRRGSDPKKKDGPTVYVTKTTRVVSGGLPTLGKRAR